MPSAILSPRDLAKREDERRELAALRQYDSVVEPFAAFVRRLHPDDSRFWPVPPHLRPLYRLIQRTRTERVFATVSMPPRHGKTTTFRLGFAWRVFYDPACLNVYASFGHDLAEETAIATRKIALETLGLRLARGKVLDWKTREGGGLKSTSVHGSITGRGVNGGIAVGDDLLKGFEAAASVAEKDGIAQWMRSDFLSRLEGGSSCIVCNTRWAEDDPVGRLKGDVDGFEPAKAHDWIHINLPAIHDGNLNPIDERKYPEKAVPLWIGVDASNPTREGALAFYASKRAEGEREWWSLYQGVPRSESAKMFSVRPEFFDLKRFTWEGKRACVALDPAVTAKQTADNTAVVVPVIEGYGLESRVYVRKAATAHINGTDAARLALVFSRVFKLPIVCEANGAFKMVPQTIRELQPGIALIEIYAAQDKKIRATPWSKLWQRGRVLVPGPDDEDEAVERALRQVWDALVRHEMQGKGRGWVLPEYPVLQEHAGIGWIEPYVKEHLLFTGLGDGRDDQVDGSAHGYNRLYKETPGQADAKSWYPSVL